MKSLFLWIPLTVIPESVHGFSAHLSRPWEPPTNSLSIMLGKKRYQQEQQVSATDDEDDDDDKQTLPEETTEDDGYESMTLQDNHALLEPHRVFVASGTAHTAAMTEISTSTTILPVQPTATVLSCWRPLLAMTRPSNFLGVVLFHILGTYLATKGTKESLTLALSTPSMCVTLLALLLTSATSMVVNDYYDNKLGVDSSKRNKPLVGGQVTMKITKRFLYYLYATLLLCLTVIPGVPARLSVVIGLMLTFWYTKHLKPITWLKNVVCASLIALSPLTSGSAALAGQPHLGTWHVLTVAPLWRLTAMLFCGFVGREMMMDINDVVDDRLYKVRTVPVKYGRKVASLVTFITTLCMAILALVDSSRVALAGIGSAWMIYRAWQVYNVQGQDRIVVDRAIEEGKWSVLLLLASFV